MTFLSLLVYKPFYFEHATVINNGIKNTLQYKRIHMIIHYNTREYTKEYNVIQCKKIIKCHCYKQWHLTI